VSLLTKRNLAIAGGVLLVLVGALVLALGGGDGEETAATTTASTTTTAAPTTTSVPRELAPLTGLPIDAIPQRPALVVKIDNAEGLARPQAGLNEADIVYEERVEGGVTRFAAVFHSNDAESVGPVRSGRTTDVGLVSNLQTPLFAFSGANSGILSIIRRADLVDVGYDAATDAYARRGDRRAPDDLFTTTAALWANTPEEWKLPVPLFQYRAKGEALPAAATEVQGVDVGFTGAASVPVQYRWDAERGGWARSQSGTPHVDEAKALIAPHNVIIQYVDYVNTGFFDVAGTPVPEASLYGFGEGLLLTSGHAIEVRWGRAEPGEPTRWEDPDGNPVRLTPGRTWVHLVPSGNTTLVP
jgi:hypothetical protein